MFIIIGVSILSLVLSIISLTKENPVGRYQLLSSGDSPIYIIDTKTSQVFVRYEIDSEGNAGYHNLGTIEQPYSIIGAYWKSKERN